MPANQESLRAVMSSPQTRYYAFVLLMSCVFLMGGGSRSDIESLLILRPLSLMFIAYALIITRPEIWSRRLAPLYFLAVLAAITTLQLIPLPPSVWVNLPHREVYADIASLAGIEQPWRPLTLSPSKTWNSLWSLTIPLAAFLLYLNLEPKDRRKAIISLIVLCALSALVAIFQIAGSSRGPLYFYRITNFGTPVGLFANRNHQAVMLACLVLMLGWYAGTKSRRGNLASIKVNGAIAVAVLLVPLIIITGSRAGVVLMLPALFMVGIYVLFGNYYSHKSERNFSLGKYTWNISIRKLILIVIATLFSLVIGLTLFLSRSLAFDRLFGKDVISDMRGQVSSTLEIMAQGYFPFGSGFGSFEYAFKQFETYELLRPTYLNQAHNDWLQFVIEGGLPAILLLIALLIWLAKRSLFVVRLGLWSSAGKASIMSLGVLSFCAAASIVDYPLRVPTLMAFAVVMLSFFGDNSRENSAVRRNRTTPVEPS